MKIGRDSYLKHYIYEYRKSMSVESPELQEKLNAILDHALAISSNRDEFFELLSYGNFKLTSHKGEASADLVKQEMNLEKLKINAYNRANSLVGETPVVKEVDPYAIVEKSDSRELVKREIESLSEEQRKVVTELCYNDHYIQSLIAEMNKGYEYIMTLQKTAIARVYMRLNEFNQDEPAKSNGPVKSRSLGIPKDGALG